MIRSCAWGLFGILYLTACELEVRLPDIEESESGEETGDETGDETGTPETESDSSSSEDDSSKSQQDESSQEKSKSESSNDSNGSEETGDDETGETGDDESEGVDLDPTMGGDDESDEDWPSQCFSTCLDQLDGFELLRQCNLLDNCASGECVWDAQKTLAVHRQNCYVRCDEKDMLDERGKLFERAECYRQAPEHCGCGGASCRWLDDCLKMAEAG